MLILLWKIDFAEKLRLVDIGDMVESPSTLIYFSIISKTKARIALLSASNDVDFVMFDINNVHSNTK